MSRRWFFILCAAYCGKQCLWLSISPQTACLGQCPQAPLNTEFHSVATRSANAFDQDQLTAGRGLFLFQHPVLEMGLQQ